MCLVCNQKTQNEAENKIYKEAMELAAASGLWVGIYTDENGDRRYVRADFAQGYPIKKWVTPNMLNA